MVFYILQPPFPSTDFYLRHCMVNFIAKSTDSVFKIFFLLFFSDFQWHIGIEFFRIASSYPQ